MAFRSVLLSNGDSVRISESVLRGAGPRGPIGPAGPPGVATTIRGTVPNHGSLPTTGRQGDGYIAQDTGILWVWNTLITPADWTSAGRVVGPSGVTSIGAQRARAAAVAIPANQTYAMEYASTPWNDPDPLESGNTNPSAGAVIDETKSTTIDTVVWPANPTYYLVTTRFTVASDVEEPTLTLYWRNVVDSTSVATETKRTYEWDVSPGVEGDVVVSHVAVLKTSNADTWRFVVKPDVNITVSSVTTLWTRIGGASGPQGLTGPPPNLVNGTTTSVPNGQPPVFNLTQVTPGTYRVDVSLPTGPQGAAGSGYASFDAISAGGNSEADPGEQADVVTDQAIPVPDGAAKPVVPWYLRAFANSIYRKLVSRLTTAQRTARGTPEAGEVVYDSTTKQFFAGVPSGATQAWFILPTIEYGQSTSVYHGASTTRPNGSLYFKHET